MMMGLFLTIVIMGKADVPPCESLWGGNALPMNNPAWQTLTGKLQVDS